VPVNCYLAGMEESKLIYLSCGKGLDDSCHAGEHRLVTRFLKSTRGLLGLLGLAVIAFTIWYKVSLIQTFGGVASVSEAFGQKVDLRMRYPEFSLPSMLNGFHVLTFLLLLLDFVNILKTIWFLFFQPIQQRGQEHRAQHSQERRSSAANHQPTADNQPACKRISQPLKIGRVELTETE